MSNLNPRYTRVPGSASEQLSTETPSSRRSWSKYLIGSVLILFGLVVMSDFSVLNSIHQQTIVLHATGSETEIDSSSPSSSSEIEDNQIENEPIESESPVEKDEGKSNIRGEKKDKTKEKEKKNKDKDEKKEKQKEKKDKSKKELRPIETIALLGERNSGTTWMFDELTKCFGDDLIVKKGLTRDKHWFQYDDGKEHEPTLVITQFRNPYHWILGMMSKPHHAPLHMFLPWKEFVSKPWTMPREGLDLEIPESDIKKGKRICQEGFKYHELNTCIKHVHPPEYYTWNTHFSEQTPFYEMRNDGSGEPFANILELRAAKIRDILTYDSFPFVEKVIPVQYEALVSEGTSWLIKEIEELSGHKAKCTPSPKQNRKVRPVEHDFLEYMNKHADWDAEKLIGYEKWLESP